MNNDEFGDVTVDHPYFLNFIHSISITIMMSTPKKRILLFCASYVREESRLAALFRMVDSWRAQTTPVPLYLSICASRDRLNRVKDGCHDAVISPHKKPLSQFQQMALLAEDVARGGGVTDTYIAFVDDDDQLAPQRMQTFYEILAGAETGYNQLAEECRIPFVQIMRGVPGGRSEFWEYCVRLDILLYFTRHADIELLKSQYADCVFARYLVPPMLGRCRPITLAATMSTTGNQYIYTTPLPNSDLQHASFQRLDICTASRQQIVDHLSHKLLFWASQCVAMKEHAAYDLWCAFKAWDEKNKPGLLQLLLTKSDLTWEELFESPVLRAGCTAPLLYDALPELLRPEMHVGHALVSGVPVRSDRGWTPLVQVPLKRKPVLLNYVVERSV